MQMSIWSLPFGVAVVPFGRGAADKLSSSMVAGAEEETGAEVTLGLKQCVLLLCFICVYLVVLLGKVSEIRYKNVLLLLRGECCCC